MSAKRTDPRVHCYQRPLNGGYITQAGTTAEHLRAVFDAERKRIAAEKKTRRRRSKPALTNNTDTSQVQTQLQLVA